MSSKHKRKGKFKGDRFIKVPHLMYDSLAFQSLSVRARCLLLEFRRRFNSYNNGQITLSIREAATVIKGSKSTACTALGELQQRGFVRVVSKGVYQNRHATSWLLTFEEYNGATPTHDWKHYPAIKYPVLTKGWREGEKENGSAATETESPPDRTAGGYSEENAAGGVLH